MVEGEIVLANTKDLAKRGDQEMVSHVQGALAELGIGADYTAGVLKSLLENSFILTNSGEKYRDNKTVLETIKLVLKLQGAKVGDGPQIAIFNNTGSVRSEDGKLKY